MNFKTGQKESKSKKGNVDLNILETIVYTYLLALV